MEMDMGRLMQVWGYTQTVSDNVAEWPKEEVEAMVSMIMENWCKANDHDVVEMADEVNEAVKNVNEMLGRY